MNEDRRDFIKKSGTCALGMVAMATQMQFLGNMSAMAQRVFDEQKEQDATAPDAGYKAIVMLFTSGGNDGNNMIIPNHNDGTISNYTTYFNARNTQGLALSQGSLLPIAVPRLGGLTYGLHPNLGPPATMSPPAAINGTTIVNNGIHELWALGKLAAVVNVGTLVQPLTKAQYQSSAFKKPYQLFSHQDQVDQFQTAYSSSQSFTGWGGRVADNMTAGNNPGGLIPMITSIAGAQLFTAGQTTLPLAIADSNTPLANVLNLTMSGSAGTAARLTAFNSLRTQDLSSSYIAAASHVTDLAMAADNAFNTAPDTTVTFPNTGLGRQLRQVARVIKDSTALNVTRQIFYVQVGGFDTHSNQPTGQGNLMTQVSQALRSFWDELGAQGMQNNVTTFTTSDFCRTFNPAGTGSGVGTDHAWGNHMFVLGGSVIGGDFYGSLRPDGSGNYFPTLTMGGPDDIDTGSSPRGRWLPTTSVDQYAAQLARWYGLPQDAATLAQVFPNLNKFPGTFSQLGFLP